MIVDALRAPTKDKIKSTGAGKWIRADTSEDQDNLGSTVCYAAIKAYRRSIGASRVPQDHKIGGCWGGHQGVANGYVLSVSTYGLQRHFATNLEVQAKKASCEGLATVKNHDQV